MSTVNVHIKYGTPSSIKTIEMVMDYPFIPETVMIVWTIDTNELIVADRIGNFKVTMMKVAVLNEEVIKRTLDKYLLLSEL